MATGSRNKHLRDDDVHVGNDLADLYTLLTQIDSLPAGTTVQAALEDLYARIIARTGVSSSVATLAASAILLKTALGTRTGDAIIKRQFGGSVYGDAYIYAPVYGSFDASSVVQKTLVGGFSADMLVAGSGTYYFDFSGSSIVRRSMTGDADASAIISRLYTGSIPASAILLRMAENSVAASAILKAAREASAIVDSVILKPQSDSVLAQAILRRTQSGSAYFDSGVDPVWNDWSDIWENSTGVEGSFISDAAIIRTMEQTGDASAVIAKTMASDFSGDSIVSTTVNGSATADADIISVVTVDASASADAIVKTTHTVPDIRYTHLTSVNGQVTNLTTGTITPQENALVLVAAYSAWGDESDPTSVSGCGLTFEKVKSQAYYHQRLSLWRAQGSATSGTITATWADASGLHEILVGQFSGVKVGDNGSAALVQVASNYSNSDTGLTVTLAPFSGSTNATYGFFGQTANDEINAEAGYTVGAFSGYDYVKLVAYKLSPDTTPTAYGAFAPAHLWGGIAGEVSSNGVMLYAIVKKTQEPTFLAQAIAKSSSTGSFELSSNFVWSTTSSFDASAVIKSTEEFGGPVSLAFERITEFAGTGVNVSSSTITSLKPDSLVLVAVDTIANALPTSVSGCGLTFAQIASQGYWTSSSPSRQLSLWRAMGTPTSGTITVTHSSSRSAYVHIVQFTGAETGNNGANAVRGSATSFTNAGTSVTATLPAFHSDGQSAGFSWSSASADGLSIGVESGWSLNTTTSGSTGTYISIYRLNTTDNTLFSSWSGLSRLAGIVGIEVRPAIPKPSADAVIHKSQTGSFGASAHIVWTQPGSLTADSEFAEGPPPVQLVGYSSAATSTVSMPAGIQAGDLGICVFVRTNASGVAPGSPVDWTQLYYDSAAVRYSVAYKTLTGSETSITQNGGNAANFCGVVVYRNASYAQAATTNGTSATLTIPALAISDRKFVVGFGFDNQSVQSLSAATMTTRSSGSGSANLWCGDSGYSVTGFSGSSLTITSATWRGISVGLQCSVYGSVTASAVIKSSPSASAQASGIVRATQTGSSTADAEIG